MSKTVLVIGMVWYHTEDYDAILRIMSDRDQLPRRFDVWLAKAERGEQERTRQGQIVVRAYIDPETFPDWCRSRNLNVDSEARMLYANTVAKNHAGSCH